MSTQEQILSEIEAFLTREGMAPTAFGLAAMRDKGFVNRLRAGGNITVTTADRLRNFMASHHSARKEVA
jgi:hypothetical protein